MGILPFLGNKEQGVKIPSLLGGVITEMSAGDLSLLSTENLSSPSEKDLLL